MALVGVVKLTDRGRIHLSRGFKVLSAILAVLSLVLMINSIYITFFVAPTLHSEKDVIRLIFSIIGMLSMQLTIYYSAGIVICDKCHREAYKKSSRYLLRIWTISGYSSIINIFIIGTMAPGVSNHIVRSMHHSMLRGMKRYLRDWSWKKVIDSMQFKLKCCGSKYYTDWHEISWIDIYHIINNSAIFDNFRINGDRVYVPAVPFSCCRVDYQRQCFHDPIQQYQYLQDWKKLISESVYNVGCVEKLRLPVENSFLIFILFSYLLFLLQLGLSIMSRYLYTSYKNSIILGDPFGTAPGWLLGGNALQIMGVKNAVSEET